ncbi:MULTISPECIES: hypothetical protein [unclassified Nocardia]|uniref:hypothetical protein n=1 Tax=unclassified Nocardia TaxID=2637762 RepID=UPI001CE44316|nr:MULTISPECIES: hypothetical protein [unclassified Nocardia]
MSDPRDPNATAKLIADIAAAGYTVEEFIRRLHNAIADDTVELPRLSGSWVIPPPGQSL